MSLIKPSHKGLLHKQLGIPEGQKIGRARLEAAAHSSDPTERKRAQFALNFNDHGTHGYVTNVGAHYSRPDDYATITVAHGKRSKRKDTKGNAVSSDYDDRPTSTITVPKSRAHMYRVGMQVGVGAVPLNGPDTDEMDDPRTARDKLTRSILSGGKRKG